LKVKELCELLCHTFFLKSNVLFELTYKLSKPHTLLECCQRKYLHQFKEGRAVWDCI